MTRTLILHIGTEKTGTTSIQDFFHRNREPMRARGVHYFECLGQTAHRALAVYGMRLDRFDDYFVSGDIKTRADRERFNERLKHGVIAEVGRLPAGIRTCVISTEHLHSRTKYRDEIDRVRDLVAPLFDEVRVIVYLRPQVDLAVSLYSTVLKAGEPIALDAFVREHCIRDEVYYDYEVLLSRWAEAFGRERVTARVFDATRFAGGNVVVDFCRLVGIEDTDGLAPARRMNESLSPFGQFLVRAINAAVPALTEEGDHNAVSVSLLDAVGRTCPGRASIGAALAREKHELWRDVNERVRAAWFPQLEELFPFDASRYGESPITFGDAERATVEAMLEVISWWSVSDRHASVLRDAALALEPTDLEKARALMEAAHKIRPYEGFIQHKLEAYPDAAPVGRGPGRLRAAWRALRGRA